MLIDFANQLDASRRKRHVFFLAVTAITLLFIGYQFGTFDEAMHIPFLQDMAYPQLYPGDKMLSLHSIYYSYFWTLFIPVFKLGLLEPVLFITHITSIYLSYWAIWDLSKTLFNRPLSAMLAVLGFIIPHFGFSGFPIFEFAPLSRTFVLPFLIIAINQFLKGRIILAFFIAGLMYNIHVVSVNFILAMFGLACLLEFSKIGIRKILPGMAIFIFSALPVLIWKAGGGEPVDFTLRPEWVKLLNLTFFSHLFSMVSSNPGTWLVFLCGLGAIGLFFVAYENREDNPAHVTVRIFIFAGIIVLLVNIIASYWLPVTILIQSQIVRVGLWILLLAYIFFADWLTRNIISSKIPQPGLWLSAITFFLSPFPFLPVLSWLMVKTVQNKAILKATAIITGVVILTSYLGFIWADFWHPGIYIYGEQTPWVDVQEWARDNTAIEARFITPPEKWGVQESDWRVHSMRGSVATFSELLVAAFQPGYEVEWKTRFEKVAPGALEKFNGDYFNNVKVTREAYKNLGTSELVNAACALEAQYIVDEKPSTHNLPLVYENSEYVVFDARNLTCGN